MKSPGFLVASPLLALGVLAGAFWTQRPVSPQEGPDLRGAETLVQRAHAALSVVEARHQNRFLTALDPELHEAAFQERMSMAVEQDIAEEMEAAGFQLFISDRRVDRRRKSAVEANRCASCHHRLGPGGAGGLVDNYFGERNPPALGGSILLERVAAEMSADLAADSAAGRPLDSKGITFGSKETPVGVSKDLRIKPFGRGRWATLDEAIAIMGSQALGVDLSVPEKKSLRAWIATLPAPGLEPPDSARMPDLFERFQRGRTRFQAVGCASCHVPEVSLQDGTVVRAYTDFKFHDLGADLVEKGERKHLTAPLWGLAGTAPWLHDGRALASLDDAIFAHAGEAESATKAYLALSTVERGELKVFLLSLAPEPKLQIAGQ